MEVFRLACGPFSLTINAYVSGDSFDIWAVFFANAVQVDTQHIFKGGDGTTPNEVIDKLKPFIDKVTSNLCYMKNLIETGAEVEGVKLRAELDMKKTGAWLNIFADDEKITTIPVGHGLANTSVSEQVVMSVREYLLDKERSAKVQSILSNVSDLLAQLYQPYSHS